IRFQRALQFAVTPDPWVTENGRANVRMCCHFVILRVLELRCLRLTKGEAGSVSCRAPPSEAADRHAFGARHTGRSSDSWAPCFCLLDVASQVWHPVRCTSVVPTYRCGAVPDSHRVPSYDDSASH